MTRLIPPLPWLPQNDTPQSGDFWQGRDDLCHRVYGKHFCVNIVCDHPNFCSAVLIRALAMESLPPWAKGITPKEKIAAGPAKLCHLLHIDLRLNGQELSPQSGLWLEAGTGNLAYPIYQTTLIGTTKGVALAVVLTGTPCCFSEITSLIAGYDLAKR